MTRVPRIRSTIPPATFGQQRERLSKHAIYLKLSHLELEKRRRGAEMDLMRSRLTALQQRVNALTEEIERLKALEAEIADAATGFEASAPEAGGALRIEY